jgi:hypothetical protein
MKDVVIQVQKGMVAGIYSEAENIRFVVVDLDCLEYGGISGTAASLVESNTLESMPTTLAWEYGQVISQ